MERWRALLGTTFVALFALGFVACSDGDDKNQVTPTIAEQPSATPVNTITPVSTDTPPLGRHTDIPEVDAVLDAVESGDSDRVLALVHFASIPCVPSDSNIRGPVCGPDQESGSLVIVVPVSICEEGLFGRDELSGYLNAELIGPVVYAVYEPPLDLEPEAQYVAVFSTEPQIERMEGLAIAIDNGQIVKIYFAFPSSSGCALSPPAIVRGLGLVNEVLPPLQQ